MIMSSHVGLGVTYRSLALAYIAGQRGVSDDHVLPRGPGATNRSLALAYVAGQRGVRDDHVLPRGPVDNIQLISCSLRSRAARSTR